MKYELVKTPNGQYKIYWMIIILFACGLILFKSMHFKFIGEKFDVATSKKNKVSDNSAYTQLRKQAIDYNVEDVVVPAYNLGVCSKNCCATQWPVPMDITERSKIDKKLVGTEYSSSSMTCNNGVIDTGCVCLTKQGKDLLGNRGYQKELPMGNGLLNQDNRKSVFKMMDKTNKPLVFGQSDELTGTNVDKLQLNNKYSGKYSGKKDIKLDKYRTILSDKDLAKNYSMAVNDNIISFDNQLINNALVDTNISGNILTPTDQLLSRPIGSDTKQIFVDRK
jgi:hypothetical protein